MRSFLHLSVRIIKIPACFFPNFNIRYSTKQVFHSLLTAEISVSDNLNQNNLQFFSPLSAIWNLKIGRLVMLVCIFDIYLWNTEHEHQYDCCAMAWLPTVCRMQVSSRFFQRFVSSCLFVLCRLFFILTGCAFCSINYEEMFCSLFCYKQHTVS